MSSLLRSRKQCFYCGHKSSQTLQKHTRSWQCSSCQAVNHLDENGEITDPPTEEVASTLSASQRFARPTSTRETSKGLFCRKCLSNQDILTKLLSEYLPPPGHPDYKRREAEYPQYKKELEDRYPQVCRACEPNVRKQIRQTGYDAKADHLKRLMQRSRQRQFANRWGWRSLVVRSGSLGQLLSWLGHSCWTASVILSGLGHTDEQLSGNQNPPIASCINNLLLRQSTSTGCVESFFGIAGWALLLGLLTIWWNPKWHHKLEGREGRLIGLTRYYYRLQAPAITLRFAIWIASQWIDNTKLVWSMHVVSTPVLIVLLGLAAVAIQVDTTPLVTWQMDIAPLVDANPPWPSQAGAVADVANFGSHTGHQTSSARGTFPVSSLAAGNTQQQRYQPASYSAVYETDEMEWEPSQGSQGFRPTSYADKYAQPISQPSPFYGRLPPAPTRRPLHGNAEQAAAPKDSIGLAPGHFDKPAGAFPIQTAPKDDLGFAPPKFFPDRDIDTGLESIFGRVFSLGDSESSKQGTSDIQPASVDTTPAFDATTVGVESHASVPSKPSEFHLVAALLLAILLAGWILLGFLPIPAGQLKIIMTASTGGASALLLASTAKEASPNLGVLGMYLAETLFAAIWTAYRYQVGRSVDPQIDHWITALLGVMMAQEVLLAASTASASSPDGGYAPTQAAFASTYGASPNLKHAISANDHIPPQSPYPTSSSTTTSNYQSKSQPQAFSVQPEKSRPRFDSFESSTSADDSDADSITSTLTSNTTISGIRNRDVYGQGNIPGLGFGGLNLDEDSRQLRGNSATSTGIGSRRQPERYPRMR